MLDIQDIWRKKSGGGFVSENLLSSAQPRAANPLSSARPHASATSTQTKPPPSAPSRASTVSLRAGDTLWEVAQKKLGDGNRWRELHKVDGSRFTAQEARHLQVGTRVNLPGVKVTTQTPHPVMLRSSTPRVSTQVLRPGGITRREFTPGSTTLTRSNQFSASPALFSRTSQVSSQLVGAKGITRREYFNASNYKTLRAGGNRDLSDSTNNNVNQIGSVAKGVALGSFVAVRGIRQTAVTPRPAADLEVAEQPAADMSRKRVRSDTRELSHLHPTRGGTGKGWADKGSKTGKYVTRGDAAKILGNAADNGENPTLKNILEKDKNGEWKIQTRYHMGHVGASRHSGRREMFALEDKKSNEWDGIHRERKGQILQKRAVLVKNVPFPIELETARRMERDGELPKGSVKNASPHPGYAARLSFEKKTSGGTEYTRPVKVTDKAIDQIRDKLFLQSELKERSPREQKRLRDKIAAGEATDADITDRQHKQRIKDMRELVPDTESAKKLPLSERNPSAKILRTYESYTESLHAIAPANTREARAADKAPPSNRVVRRVRAAKDALQESRVVKGVRGNHLKLREARAAGVDRVATAIRESTAANTTRRAATAIRESTAANTTRRAATAVRESGVTKGVLRGASRVAAPLAIGLDAWQLKNAYQKDGFGSEFRKEVGRVAGGWGGAAAGAAGGAAIGSVVPVVGTAAGAIVGGVIGGVAGSEFGDDIEQGAEKAGKAIADGAKNAWNKLFG